jgi:hypothetical protein
MLIYDMALMMGKMQDIDRSQKVLKSVGMDMLFKGSRRIKFKVGGDSTYLELELLDSQRTG